MNFVTLWLDSPELLWVSAKNERKRKHEGRKKEEKEKEGSWEYIVIFIVIVIYTYSKANFRISSENKNGWKSRWRLTPLSLTLQQWQEEALVYESYQFRYRIGQLWHCGEWVVIPRVIFTDGWPPGAFTTSQKTGWLLVVVSLSMGGGSSFQFSSCWCTWNALPHLSINKRGGKGRGNKSKRKSLIYDILHTPLSLFCGLSEVLNWWVSLTVVNFV